MFIFLSGKLQLNPLFEDWMPKKKNLFKCHLIIYACLIYTLFSVKVRLQIKSVTQSIKIPLASNKAHLLARVFIKVDDNDQLRSY